jgi:hypothetical protein
MSTELCYEFVQDSFLKEYSVFHFRLLVPDMGRGDSDRPKTEEARELQKQLLNIPGVERAKSDGRYAIKIVRARKYSWCEIKQHVVATVAKHCDLPCYEPLCCPCCKCPRANN